jgi:glycerol-3-phosphate acyltransferase PlsY
MAKGPIPVLAAWLLGAEPWLAGAAGVAVVIGQMWPVFRPSTGGKGNSTGLFMALALAPGPLLVALVPIVISLLIRTAARLLGRHSLLSGPPSNSLPIGMLVGFSLLPVLAYVMGEPTEVALALLALWAAIVFRRLTAGLRADLRQAPWKGQVIFNRLLYDRSFGEMPPGKER